MAASSPALGARGSALGDLLPPEAAPAPAVRSALEGVRPGPLRPQGVEVLALRPKFIRPPPRSAKRTAVDLFAFFQHLPSIEDKLYAM